MCGSWCFARLVGHRLAFICLDLRRKAASSFDGGEPLPLSRPSRRPSLRGRTKPAEASTSVVRQLDDSAGATQVHGQAQHTRSPGPTKIDQQQRCLQLACRNQPMRGETSKRQRRHCKNLGLRHAANGGTDMVRQFLLQSITDGLQFACDVTLTPCTSVCRILRHRCLVNSRVFQSWHVDISFSN